MFFGKKANCDLILLLFLVLRIELDSDFLSPNSLIRESASQSVRIGSTSAYTRISVFPNLGYPHPKQQEIDATIFSRLHFFNSVRRDREVLITNIVEDKTLNVSDAAATSEGNVATQDRSEVRLNDLPNSQESLELTPEEMDLIEILWKQDIDLGVSRDAYDCHQLSETEKLKEVEYFKEKNLFDQKDFEEPEEPVIVPDPFSGLNYTVDSETGEYILDGFSTSLNCNSSLCPVQENSSFPIEKKSYDDCEETATDVSLDSPYDLDTFLPFENEECCNLNELISINELADLIPDDLILNSNYSLPQLLDAEKELEHFELLSTSNGNNTSRSEMYPNLENCWTDATIPLFGAPYQSTSNQISSPTRESSDSLLTADFQAVSPSVGSSSIGYAVAESIATLTNGSDPTPVGSLVNNAYGEELPELLYPNHTVTVQHNDLISDLFLDELQLMALPSNDNTDKPREHQVDSSNDSASSGNFPSVPDCDWIDSCSESSLHHEDDQTRCELLLPHSQIGYLSTHQNTDSPQVAASAKKYRQSNKNQTATCVSSLIPPSNCNDQQFYTLKTYYSDQSENSACAISCSATNFNKKFEYSLPKSSNYNCSNYLQHNHTYHQPFNNAEHCHKPVARDKHSSYSDDDSSNKDEKRAKELKIPISISDIINLAIEEYNERLSKFELSEAQITLIRDIRRRGKNKVAAQNCRKRKMDQISHLQHDLDYLQDEKNKLKSKKNHLLQQKHVIEEKYAQLHDLILKTTTPTRPSLSTFNNNQNTTSDIIITESSVNGGTKAKKKLKK